MRSNEELVVRYYDRDVEFDKTMRGIRKEVRSNPEKYAYEFGVEDGIEQGKQNTILELLKSGVPDKYLIKATGLTKKELEDLKNKINN